MYRLRAGPRFDYRELETARVKASPTLVGKFPELKSLTMDLGCYNSSGTTRNSQVKFTPNLLSAKAVFRVDCPNSGCIRGDFDLTDVIARAVAARRTEVSGELRCEGWQSKTTIDKVPCHNLLRYQLNLAY